MLTKQKIVLALFEVGLEFMNVILFVGFTFFNAERTSTPVLIVLLLMALGEPIAFIIGWFRPQIGASLIASLAVATLLGTLITVGVDVFREGRWIAGGIFWIAKFVLAALMYSIGMATCKRQAVV